MDTYLCSIAHHQYVSMLRRQKHIDFRTDTAQLSAPGGMEEALADRDTARQLYLLLHRLEEPYKEVLPCARWVSFPLRRSARCFRRVTAGPG